MGFVNCILALATLSGIIGVAESRHVQRYDSQATANNSQLLTWWHDTGVVNTKTTIANDQVRQSGIYNLQVATDSHSDSTYYDSFVYNVIPANGMPDQFQYTAVYNHNQTQSWSSFLYSEDVTLKITRNGKSKPGDVIVRPTNLDFDISCSGESVYIKVPYNSHGFRFSVEFSDDLVPLAPSESLEPLNALLIFASPMEDASLVPDPKDSAVIPEPGCRVLGLNTTSASTVIFYPGVYYFTGTDRMLLSESVKWVYFAPGAYVKGAVQFQNTGSEVKATGHGVLSGEQYVWYADPDIGYKMATAVNNNGLRMWSGNVTDAHQNFVLNGPTVCAPPFNSMDWNGDNLDLVTCLVKDYKQVGAFYGQTDGIEMYPGSLVQDVFYHTDDDTIKMYYSNVVATNIVVWKVQTAPIVQFGWSPRDTENVTIDKVTVIHQAYHNAASNPGLIGSDNNYLYAPDGLSSNHHTADSNMTTKNIVWSNFRSEGLSACLFRIYALQNLANIRIKNFWIEKFEPPAMNTTESWIPAFYDVNNSKQITVSDFVISGFKVGDTDITAHNAKSIGLIDIDPAYKSNVRIE